MSFPKYSIKIQIIISLIFGPLNYLTTLLNSNILQLPLFNDMVFVYAASLFGVPCGIITGIIHTLIHTIANSNNPLHMLYCICCITGTILTWILINRKNEFSWVRIALLIVISTIVISLEGAFVYYIFFSNDSEYMEDRAIFFLVYNLVNQNMNIILSAFLARLPVNLIDKSIAVLGGLGIYQGIKAVVNKVKKH